MDTNAFTCGFNVFGLAHVVFATNYSYGRNKGEYVLESWRRCVDQAQMDAETRRKIYEDSAKALLHLACASAQHPCKPQNGSLHFSQGRLPELGSGVGMLQGSIPHWTV
jgi:hypothetical protein